MTVATPVPVVRGWPLTGRGEALELVYDASADPRLGAVLLTGPPGVGKTRLAQEVIDRHAEAGDPTLWLSCPADAAVALAAFAPILPAPDLAASPFAQVRDALSGLAGGRRVVVGLDDAHAIDPLSASLLLPLVESGAATLVATVADDVEPPASLAALWRSGRAQATAVTPLDALDVDTLLHRVLGGCVDGRVVAELADISRGNVLFLRELVTGSLAAGVLTEIDGVWHLSGRPAGTTMLSAMVRRRLAALPDDVRTAVEHVAVAGELALHDLVELIDDGAVEAAEGAGLIHVEDAVDGPVVRVADALQREVLLAGLGRVRRARLSREIADRLEEAGPAADSLRIAHLRLDADGRADPALLLRAAHQAQALRDLPALERMTRAALRASGTPDGEDIASTGTEAAGLLASARYELGGFDEADRLLTGLASAGDAADERTRAHLVSTHASVIGFGLGRLDDAVALLDDAESAYADPVARDLLRQRRAIHTLWARGPLAADAVLAAPEEGSSTDVVGPARTTVGALRGATRAAVTAAGPDHDGVPGLADIAALLALTESGRLVEAAARAEAVYRRVSAARLPLVQVWVAHALGRIALARGRAGTARRWFQEQYALAREVQQVLPLRLAVAGGSTACALLGDDAGVARAAGNDDGASLADGGQLFPGEIAVGRAWRSHSVGELALCRNTLVAGAEHCLAIGSPGQAALAAHTLVRLGWPDDGVRLLEQCRTDSPLVLAWLAHGRGLVDADADRLERAADDLAAHDALLVAAEAAAGAATAALDRGLQRRAQALRAKSNQWAAECEGALTPGLAGGSGMTPPLTRREQEIAALVGQGRTSREVAAALVLSVRTVDNHLQRIFAKLGVSSRGDLAAALTNGSGPSVAAGIPAPREGGR